jgi:hypothetical protein
LAEDSYEQQVASLVRGKRDLFDNVINPEGSEDVVGVSKKMLHSIIEELGIVDPETGEIKSAELKLPEPIVDDVNTDAKIEKIAVG